MTNNNTYFKIVLNTALAVGDVITSRGIGGIKDSAPKGIWVTSATSRPSSAPSCTGTSSTSSWVDILSYTVTSSDDLVGKTEIYIYRAAGATTDFNNFVITRPVADTRTDVTLSFPEASYNASLGSAFEAPTLTADPAAASSEVTYSSSNTSVATVNTSTGAVTLVGAGTTTITAAISGSENYKDASASYSLTVIDPNVKTVAATWAFSTGATGQNASFVYTPTQSEEYFYANGSVSLGSNLSYNGQQALKLNNEETGDNSTKIRIAASTETSANEISFTIKPRKGVTFTPTAVSFRATRCGTNGGKMTMTWIDTEHSAVALGTAAADKTGAGLTDPARDNNDTQNWTDYSYNLTAKGAVATTGDCGLKILLYSVSDKDYALGNIVIEGTFTGIPEEETMYNVTTSVTPTGAGMVNQSPTGTSIAEGTSVTFTATPNTGYAFLNKWTVNEVEQEGESYTIASLAANTDVVAQFKQLYSIDYNKTAEGVLVGTCNEVLKTEYASAADKFTAPSCLYMTKPGYTFVNWKDADENVYEAGTEYTLTKNIVLTPQFTENTEALTKNLSNTTVTWNFRSSSVHFNSQGNTQYYVQKATVNGESIDVAMLCDQTSGKLNNSNRNDQWAQANGGTKLTIPAISGMTIVATAYNKFTSTTFAGSTDYDASEEEPWTATYSYTGSDETIDIVIGNDISYLATVTVTYPKTHTYVDVTSVGYRTFASSSALDFSEAIEGLTAYKATMNGNTVNFTPIDCAVPAATGMLIKAAEGRYYIPLATGTPEDISNAFVGVTSSQTIDAGSFVLMNGAQGIGFYKTTSTFTAGANTAYLPASVAAAKTFIGFDEAMGIESPKTEKTANSQWFNLAGQRVVQPKKGLYIQNGKKVIVK